MTVACSDWATDTDAYSAEWLPGRRVFLKLSKNKRATRCLVPRRGAYICLLANYIKQANIASMFLHSLSSLDNFVLALPIKSLPV